MNLNRIIPPDLGCNVKKYVRIMKLTWFLIVVLTLQTSASLWSQTTSMDLKLENSTLLELFSQIENNSQYRFFYSNDDIDVNQKVSVDVTDMVIGDILNEAFKSLPYSFKELRNNMILVESKSKNAVTGMVIDESGEPIPGVNVHLKGTIKGTITNKDGIYIISSLPDDAILVFSFIGYRTQEVIVGDQTNINISMEVDVFSIDEVVAIGYGTMKKSDLTGAISSISSESLKEVPVLRVDQALQGRVAGLSVQNVSGGSPGASAKIRIRGANSILGNNNPLVVIDGFIGGGINSVSPGDIKSIEILKDASATAIYGSRGANGVIIITTKIGTKDGVIRVNYDATVSFQSVSKKVDLLTAPEFAEVANEIRSSQNLQPIYSATDINAFKANGGTDWQDVLFEEDPVLIHDHHLSVSGSTEKINFLISGSFQDHEGILVHNDNNKKLNLRSNIDIKVSDKFDIGLKVFTDRNKRVGVGASELSAGNLRWAPTIPVYDENGEYIMTQLGLLPGATRTHNPLASILEPKSESITTNSFYNAKLRYKLTNNLAISYSVGANFLVSKTRSYFNKKTNEGIISNGYGSVGASDGSNWLSTAQLMYSKEINKHRLGLTAVFEEQGSKNSGQRAGAKDYTVDNIGFDNVGAGGTAEFPDSWVWRSGLRSYVARANYVFNDKYLCTATFRADGSNKFAKENRWGYFPSGSVAWRASSESFIEALNIFHNLKFRASWGITGNQGIPSGLTVSTLYITQGYPFDNASLSAAAIGDSFANKNLKWEKTSQINLGIDMAFFGGRLSATADYYKKKTSDLLMNVSLPWAAGYNSFTGNIGIVENSGFEFQVNATPVTGTFSWNTSLSVSANKSLITDLGTEDYITIPAGGFAGGDQIGNLFRLEVGQPMGLFYGYKQVGTWGTSEEAEATKMGTIPGAPKYIDLNKDDKITEEDKMIIGTGTPDFTFGFTNSFKYKSLDLNIVIVGSVGGDIFNANRIFIERSSNDGYPTGAAVNNRWSQNNQDTDIPAFGTAQYDFNQSSRYIEDGSYVRLSDITLGYTLPKEIASKLKLSSARFYVGGNNLFTITSYSGYDPEVNVKGNNAIGSADFSAYPSVKTLLFGVNLTF